jgi:methanogenic corrinoid protein MtbC1
VDPKLRPLLDAIAALDGETIDRELSRFALLSSPAELVHEVVLPLIRLTGENWENGTFQIAQEHMFSACLRNLLGGLLRLQRPDKGSTRILFTTPAGELHEFGILAAAMLASARDFRVAYLGPNLPAGEILSAAAKCSANVVALGVMTTEAMPAIRRDIAQIAAELHPATELWAGGRGAAPVFDGVTRSGTFVLEDLADFDRHLSRWKTAASRESLR